VSGDEGAILEDAPGERELREPNLREGRRWLR
jgi:hypothetical protein